MTYSRPFATARWAHVPFSGSVHFPVWTHSAGSALNAVSSPSELSTSTCPPAATSEWYLPGTRADCHTVSPVSSFTHTTFAVRMSWPYRWSPTTTGVVRYVFRSWLFQASSFVTVLPSPFSR